MSVSISKQGVAAANLPKSVSSTDSGSPLSLLFHSDLGKDAAETDFTYGPFQWGESVVIEAMRADSEWEFANARSTDDNDDGTNASAVSIPLSDTSSTGDSPSCMRHGALRHKRSALEVEIAQVPSTDFRNELTEADQMGGKKTISAASSWHVVVREDQAATDFGTNSLSSLSQFPATAVESCLDGNDNDSVTPEVATESAATVGSSTTLKRPRANGWLSGDVESVKPTDEIKVCPTVSVN